MLGLRVLGLGFRVFGDSGDLICSCQWTRPENNKANVRPFYHDSKATLWPLFENPPCIPTIAIAIVVIDVTP